MVSIVGIVIVIWEGIPPITVPRTLWVEAPFSLEYGLGSDWEVPYTMSVSESIRSILTNFSDSDPLEKAASF